MGWSSASSITHSDHAKLGRFAEKFSPAWRPARHPKHSNALRQRHRGKRPLGSSTVAQRRIPPEGGEIERKPLLLRHLDLQGCVVSADAARAQIHKAAVIVERSGEHVLCVKGNQPTVTATMEAMRVTAAGKPHFQSVEMGHERLEARLCWASDAFDEFAPRGQWKGSGDRAHRDPARAPGHGQRQAQAAPLNRERY